MDKRCFEIFSILKSSCDNVTVSGLGKQLSVSPRTIRYDLDKIDEFLKENGLPPLIRSNCSGILLPDNEEAVERLKELVKSISPAGYFYTQHERIQRIQLELLFSDGYVTIASMCDKLMVSRSTIANDIKIAKKEFLNYGIVVKSMPRYGFILSGDERKLRDAIVSIMFQMLPGNEALGFIKEKSYNIRISSVLYREYFSDIDLGIAFKITNQLEKKLEVIWSDNGFIRIAYTVAVCLKRRDKSKQLIFTKAQLAEIENSRDYNIVMDRLKYYGSKYNISFTREESVLITLYVLCSETNSISYFKKENQIKIQISASKIIRRTGDQLNFNFSLHDMLHNTLSEHLSHAYYRIKYSIRNDSRLYSEIAKRYKEVFKAVKSSLAQFEELLGCKVPDNEVAGIATMFCGIYENKTIIERMRYRIIVVSDEGLASINLLTSKLADAFPEIDIMAGVTRHQLTNKDIISKADFIVTTTPLFMTHTKEILVDPFLDSEGIAEIKRYISNTPPKQTKPVSHYHDMLTKMVSIAYKICPEDMYEELITELIEEVGPIENIYYRRRGVIMLKDMLTVDTIKLNVGANNWEEAVKLSGELMVKAQCVEPRFVDAMLRFVTENGPYVVIAPGIAMPHARPEDGVNKLCMSLLTLSTPVEFGSEDNDPVEMVICLAAVDNSSHLDALAELLEILGDESKWNIIRTAKDAQDIIALLS